MTVKLVTIPDVELAAVGDWPTEKGWGRFTADDLASMAVHAGAAERGFNPRIKLGHGSTGLGAVPAWGRVENVRVVGDKLVGDLTHVPQPLASVMPSALPGRSIEAVRGRKGAGGESIPMVMTGLALLGVEEPAIDSLADLHAAMVGETDLVIHAAASLAGMSVEAFEESLLAAVDSAGDEPPTEEHAVSDDKNQADAEAAAKAAEDKAAADAAAEKVAEEEAAKAAEAAKADDEAKAVEAAKATEDATVVELRTALVALQTEVNDLRSEKEEEIAASRASALDEAESHKKINDSTRPAYEAWMKSDPAACLDALDKIPSFHGGPVHAERGHAGDPETLDDVALAAYEDRYGKEA